MSKSWPVSTTNSAALLQRLGCVQNKFNQNPEGLAAHQHKRYWPPAAVTEELPQYAMEPLAVTSATRPAPENRGNAADTPQVSKTKNLSPKEIPVPSSPSIKQV
jgi:hypothetical protein